MAGTARNAISRNRAWSLRAAELYDDGATDAAVAETLRAEFGCKVSARTARSFRLRDYEPVRSERLERIEDAQQVQMLMSAAADSGLSFAEAAQDQYARLMYDTIRNVRSGDSEVDGKVMIALGKNIAKLNELALDQAKFEAQQEKERQVESAKDALRANPEINEEIKAAVMDIMDQKMLGLVK